MGWNYLSIHKLQRCNRWSLGMDKLFHPTYHNGCNYLSMLGLKLNHVSKSGHWKMIRLIVTTRTPWAGDDIHKVDSSLLCKVCVHTFIKHLVNQNMKQMPCLLLIMKDGDDDDDDDDDDGDDDGNYLIFIFAQPVGCCFVRYVVTWLGWIYWWSLPRCASHQIRKLAGCVCAGNAGNIFLATDF